jgi:hypothetical protein
MAFDTARDFLDMEWTIWHAPQGEEYLTCDNPVRIIPPQGGGKEFTEEGFRAKGTRKIFPLSPAICLEIRDFGSFGGHAHAQKERVRNDNINIAYNCDELLISKSVNLLREMIAATKMPLLEDEKSGVKFSKSSKSPGEEKLCR